MLSLFMFLFIKSSLLAKGIQNTILVVHFIPNSEESYQSLLMPGWSKYLLSVVWWLFKKLSLHFNLLLSFLFLPYCCFVYYFSVLASRLLWASLCYRSENYSFQTEFQCFPKLSNLFQPIRLFKWTNKPSVFSKGQWLLSSFS